ncbi:FMN-binding protein [Hydrogenimonas sp.]
MTEAKERRPSRWVSVSSSSLLLTLLCLSQPLEAKKVDLEAMLRSGYGESMRIERKSLLLTRAEAADVQKAARMRLSSRIVRLYLVKRDNKTLRCGVVLSRKVRTKKAAVLYLITPEGRIDRIEILAFAEPPEFKPSGRWLALFDGKSLAEPLRSGEDIPAISGATLSARNVANGARLALAIVQRLGLCASRS